MPDTGEPQARPSPVRATAERSVGAPAPAVYQIIADYRGRHPHILPPAFSGLVVEQGGVGEGTIISYDLRLGGRTLHGRALVAEPEPGRVLTETDLLSGAVTTFEVIPDGEASRVRFTTSYQPAGGLQGWLERRLAPRMLRKLYLEELITLDRYAREHAA